MKNLKEYNRYICFSLMMASSPLFAKVNLTDVVYVGSENPYYIKIFEATKGDAVKAGVNSSYSPGKGPKPDRMTEHEAAAYCENIGMELATQEQWMIAASNIGRNRKYTLIGDEIQNGEKLRANINTGDSVPISYIETIGIDAIGTVGMTGNRAEWVFNNPSNSTYSQCGGSYETDSIEEVNLDNICRANSYDSPTATARCVYVVNEYDEVKVNFSGRIKDTIKSYLRQIGISESSVHREVINGILDLLINPNRWSLSGNGNQDLLEMTLPEDKGEENEK